MDGILVCQELRRFIEGGLIHAMLPFQPDQIQPASLDLRLGARIWQVPCSFLPGEEGIAAKLRRLSFSEEPLDTQRPTVLHHDGVYIVELEERLALPPDVWARANPKSSSGRLDIFVRLLTEFGGAFDTLPAGYQGRLYLEITPQSFHVAIRRGDTLGQIRLARGRPRLSVDALARWQATDPVVVLDSGAPAPIVEEDTPGLQLSVDLREGDGDRAGYLALRHRPPVDLRRRDLERDRYWTPIRPDRNGEGFVLEPEQFYIFATRERLRIPPGLSAELVPFDPTKGELRTHYAGFIDPGFGWDDARRGARLVLEIRTHDVPFLLEHGQPLFRLELLQNLDTPDTLYGQGVGSNYQMQGLKLAKQFR